jgi:poly(3-hydroxyalkanoate) synthetase
MGMMEDQRIQNFVNMYQKCFESIKPLYSEYAKLQRFTDILLQLQHPQVQWATMNNVILEHETIKLRHFPSKRKVPREKRPVLILPPQAGHHSNLADYSPAQSLVRVFQKYGYDVYVAQWISATQEHKNLGMNDILRLTDEAVEEIRRRTGVYKINLVGQCQGGWQACIYTSLHQDKIATLVSAAAPIDVHAAPSEIIEDAQMPMQFFEYMVATHNGLMNGQYILWGFKTCSPRNTMCVSTSTYGK